MTRRDVVTLHSTKTLPNNQYSGVGAGHSDGPEKLNVSIMVFLGGCAKCLSGTFLYRALCTVILLETIVHLKAGTHI